MADIKTVQLIVNSEQAKSSIRIGCTSRETGISQYNEKLSGWRTWQSKTTKPCITPFGKILDLCKRAGRQIFQKWYFTSNEGAIVHLRGITRTDF